MAGAVESSLQVNRYHGVEVVFGHLDQGPVPDDASVVDEDVDATEGANGGLDDPAGGREVAHRVVRRHRLPSRGFDVGARLRRGIVVAAAAVERHPDVVDDDIGALSGQAQGDLPADAPT